MEFAPGAITLDDIIGGTLQAGKVPNARLETNLTALADVLLASGVIPLSKISPLELTKKNAGLVTVTAAGVNIIAQSSGSLHVGDRVFIFAHLDMTKGGTGGRSEIQLYQSGGSGTVLFTKDDTDIYLDDGDHLAGAEWNVALCAIGIITADGNPAIGVKGYSWGSDSTVFAGQAQINARIFRAS